ncbi:unknown protein [Desulfotalea psychrophila LSv54]|uniref:Uncharacterized protein n=1 Tax=Desulfotalea psychrophila (strain LSv54 / DSM 12343) TaxID=177439 RepID=Q6AKW7_DESPS|nr:unknown protein [Desulfotalea psychrophila LSv54]
MRFYGGIDRDRHCIIFSKNPQPLATVLLLHHSNSFTVRADPCRAIAHTPLVFLKAFRANLKATGTAPAKWFLFFTAVTLVLTDLPLPPAFFLYRFIFRHHRPRLLNQNIISVKSNSLGYIIMMHLFLQIFNHPMILLIGFIAFPIVGLV